MNVSKIIKTLRLEQNLSQIEFAHKTGFAQQTISSWENGERIPSVNTLEKILETFGMQLSIKKKQ